MGNQSRKGMTMYRDLIKRLAPEYDPRHIEAYIRVEHSTLDHLTPERFRAEVRIARLCIDEGGREMAEQCARSFGF